MSYTESKKRDDIKVYEALQHESNNKNNNMDEKWKMGTGNKYYTNIIIIVTSFIFLIQFILLLLLYLLGSTALHFIHTKIYMCVTKIQVRRSSVEKVKDHCVLRENKPLSSLQAAVSTNRFLLFTGHKVHCQLKHMTEEEDITWSLCK